MFDLELKSVVLIQNDDNPASNQTLDGDEEEGDGEEEGDKYEDGENFGYEDGDDEDEDEDGYEDGKVDEVV